MFRCSVVFVFKYMDTFPCSRNRESGDVVSITSSLVCRCRGICYAMLGPTLLGSAEMGDPERSRGVLKMCPVCPVARCTLGGHCYISSGSVQTRSTFGKGIMSVYALSIPGRSVSVAHLPDLTERLQCSGTMASLLFSARAGTEGAEAAVVCVDLLKTNDSPQTCPLELPLPSKSRRGALSVWRAAVV